MTSAPALLDGPLPPGDRLRFETFLSDLATRLLDVPPEGLDEAIEASLAELGSRLGDTGLGTPRLVRDRGRARGDSPLVVPLRAGGEELGALEIEHHDAPSRWSAGILSRLELVAGLYASALHRRQVQEKLRRTDDLNRSVLASLSSEIVVLDAGGRVVAVNEAWTRSPRRRRHPGGTWGVGADYLRLLDGTLSPSPEQARLLEGLRGVLGGTLERFEDGFRYDDDHGIHVYLTTVTPLAHEGGGALLVCTDVTELEAAKAALEASVREVQALEERLAAENVVLQEQVRQAHGFDEIVGTSAALGRVLAQVEQVAPTDAPVLLLGETGTGKDLVARALHARSPRATRPLVTVNCAALPPTLIESELFGYEKGAFTGALARTLGRFEVAHGGTLFLDEIGELPLEVQAKLLRVLQSGEFERLGSARTLKVDVRLIAATNRDLEREVREGRFRSDLYYRLSVFPILQPALRDRPEDIPLLVWHFIARRQGALGRVVKRVPERLMRAFTAYRWPGNVRELENVVERALIMTTGSTLASDPGFLAEPAAPELGTRASLAEAERAHIRAVLDACGGRISGRGNAADRLGLKRSTLQFRMKKLGITRPSRGA